MRNTLKKLKNKLGLPTVLIETTIPSDTKIMTVDILELNNESKHEIFWEVLLGMYKGFLHKDPQWHFFFEGDYSLIRCQNRFIKPVLENLEACRLKFTEPKPWIDNSDIVRMYQTEFIPMFHCFSEIAVKIALDKVNNNRNHIVEITDRIQHCFLNHMYYNAREWSGMSDHNDTIYEAFIMAQLVIDRSHYIGQCNGIRKSQEYYKNKGKENGEDV